MGPPEDVKDDENELLPRTAERTKVLLDFFDFFSGQSKFNILSS